jgi:membrane-associated protease RseP (regulator of RpoE activity)
MTSPSFVSQPVPAAARRPQTAIRRIGLPLLLFAVTMLSTTAVGMRYMHNFRLGNPPLATDADILPYEWVFHHLRDLATGLPFSLTLISILLAHEFGHYFACRNFFVRATLPYLLPAPSLSGTFGAVIRIKSVIRSRAALIVIGASGPIAGFLVALVTVTLGLAWSTYAAAPLVRNIQPPLLIVVIHSLMQRFFGAAGSLDLIVPHPVLIASWLGLLITALNLIPAGQLDGGHIVYAISPAAHRWSSRIVMVALVLLGIFYWFGWMVWAIVLMTPPMRHPLVNDALGLTKWQTALIPICLLIFVFTGILEPFRGFGLIDLLPWLQHRYR